MKRAIVLLLVSLSVSIQLSAQGCLFDRNVDTLWYATPYAAASFGDRFLIGNGIGVFMNAGMYEVDCTGQRAWYDTPVIPGRVTDIAQAGNRIFAAGLFVDYSDVGPGFGAFVLVYDTNRNLLDWHAYIRDSLSYYNDSTITGHYSVNQAWAANLLSNNPQYRQVQLAIVDSAHILLSAWNNVVGIDATDWSIAWTKSYDGYVNDISPQINNRFYVVTNNKLYWVDTLGDSLRVNTGFYDGRQVYHADNGRDYVTANGSVMEIDTSLNMLHQYPLSVDFADFNGLTGFGNTVFLSGSYNIGNNLIAELVFDGSLQLDTSFLVEKTCSLPVAAAAHDSVVLLTGGKGTNYYRTYDRLGQNLLQHGSMKVDTIIIDTVSYTVWDTIYSSTQTYFLYHLNLDYLVTVINTGMDTIHSFSVRDDYGSLPINGYGPMWFNYYSGLSLAPGDSFTFGYPRYYYDYLVPSSNNQAPTLYFESINGAVPDAFCGSIFRQAPLFNIPTGIEEPSSLADVKIYPNPANTQITIQLGNTPTPNTIFTLTDLSGQTLLTQSLNQTQQTIDISQLPQGIYVYSIKYSDGQQVMGKICKL